MQGKPGNAGLNGVPGDEVNYQLLKAHKIRDSASIIGHTEV